MGLADALKKNGQYDEAAVYYLTAIKMKPGLSRAEYQLACDMAMWGQKKVALRYLGRAVDDGFWGYPTMLDDSDLQAVRSDPDFATLLAKVESNYKAEVPKHAPGATVKIPKGSAPSEGWPVILFMHGFGSKRHDYDPLADLASELGLVGISVDGPTVAGENAFEWPKFKAQETDIYLQQVLAKQKNVKLNLKKVYLAGFSQGAQHAAILVAMYPERYAGAVANSPGAAATMPREVNRSKEPHRLYLMIGDSEAAVNKMMVTKFESLWKAANQPVQILHFAGVHQFPPNAKDEYRKAIQWVVKGD
jgi:predicted esterase